MTRRLVPVSLWLVPLAAGALALPVPASSAATELAIREIHVRPPDPVVGPGDSVRLVIDVIVKGAEGKDGVTVTVEPGRPADGIAELTPASHTPASPLSEPASPMTAPAASPAASAGSQAAPAVSAGSGTAQAAGRPAEQRPRPVDPLPVRPAPVAGDVRPTAGVVRPAPGDGRPGSAVGAARPHGRPGARRPGEMGPAAWPNRATRLASPVPPPAADGWETWRFLPDKALNRFHPAGIWTITATARNAAGATVSRYTTFRLRRETKLTDVRVGAAPGSRAVRLDGVLRRVGPRGYVEYAPFAEQRIEILWRAAAEGDWQQVASTATGEDGGFAKIVTGRSGGQWRVRFPGTGHQAPVLSQVHDSP